MTNEQAKQKSLQEAWQFATGSELVNSDGWLKIRPYSLGRYHPQYFDYKNINDLCYVRPISLRGIEDNNCWNLLSEKNHPSEGTPVLCYSLAWVDADYNPTGIRSAHYNGIWPDVEWVSVQWDNSQDCFDYSADVPTHWKEYPNPPLY